MINENLMIEEVVNLIEERMENSFQDSLQLKFNY